MSDPVAARAAFDAYASTHRHHAPTGYRLEVLPHLTRLLSLDAAAPAYVMFACLPEAVADASIRAEIAHFESMGRGFEWKWHALDEPADLAQRLVRCGFVADEAEALLVLRTDGDAARALAAALPPAPATIQRVGVDIGVAQGVREAVALQERIWERRFDWLEAELRSAIADPQTAFELVLARAGPAVVGSGTLIGPAGAACANLHAGAVLPEWRSRGLYSALLGARVRLAREWGVDNLHVDAAPMSRPILERKGFRFICETVPFRWPAAQRTSSIEPGFPP